MPTYCLITTLLHISRFIENFEILWIFIRMKISWAGKYLISKVSKSSKWKNPCLIHPWDSTSFFASFPFTDWLYLKNWVCDSDSSKLLFSTESRGTWRHCDVTLGRFTIGTKVSVSQIDVVRDYACSVTIFCSVFVLRQETDMEPFHLPSRAR